MYTIQIRFSKVKYNSIHKQKEIPVSIIKSGKFHTFHAYTLNSNLKVCVEWRHQVYLSFQEQKQTRNKRKEKKNLCHIKIKKRNK